MKEIVKEHGTLIIAACSTCIMIAAIYAMVYGDTGLGKLVSVFLENMYGGA